MEERWEGDRRGHGSGHAGRLRPGAEELLAAMTRPDWVAEQPEIHLFPQVAECATYVRRRRGEGRVVFEAATGMVGEDTEFAPHGHVIVLDVRGAL